MLQHYLKIAFRNLWKYKLQSLISIIGLAVGYVCFAVSLLWIRYERSYDSFHDGADRMYLVGTKSERPEFQGWGHIMPYPLAEYLKQNFPEIEETCNTQTGRSRIKVNEITREVFTARPDSLFMKMFRIELLAGNLDFLIPESKKIAITEELSKTLFGNDDPIGQEIFIIYHGNYNVCAIIKDWSKHSNYPFQLLYTKNPMNTWRVSSYETFVKLKKSVDKEAFAKKIYEHKIELENDVTITNLLLIPLTSLRYKNPPGNANIGVEYKYIFLFALAGGLVIVCSLLNYITMFVCRFRMRIREFSLRIVCGASGFSLFTLLLTEFALTMFIALLSGVMLIQLLFTTFRELSNVYMNMREIYLESFLYVGFVILISLFAFFPASVVFRRWTLNVSLKKSNQNLFRKILIVLQLVISIGFIFCTAVMMKQIRFLQRTDIGIDYKNKAVISTYPAVDTEALKSQLLQIPEITEAINIYPIIPASVTLGTTIKEWEDMPGSNNTQKIDIIGVSEAYLKHYDFRLLEGELLTEDDLPENALITESGAKNLGWNRPVGKTVTPVGEHLGLSNSTYKIKGVVKDIHVSSPVIKPNPILLIREDQADYLRKYKSDIISITYQEEQYESCSKKIEELLRQTYPGVTLELTNVEDKYNEYIKSETALLKLLGFVSAVCIIISIFGFISLITLTCKERQKEIAIRKINGATVSDILLMYFKEYFLLLALGALIAFPAGYLIMKRWITQYVQQTSISAWIYILILLVLTCIIVLCIGGRVYQVARENPAEVVKGS